jgi:hypothetical protein
MKRIFVVTMNEYQKETGKMKKKNEQQAQSR